MDMFAMETATLEDTAVWRMFDRHIAPDELTRKIESGRCYLLRENAAPVGVLRYNYFWDTVPFVTLLFLEESARGKGYGTRAMARWEADMRAFGHPCVMTSAQADENAQRFYRRLGYRDAGCLLLDIPPLAQPAELFFIKAL